MDVLLLEINFTNKFMDFPWEYVYPLRLQYYNELSIK